VVELGRPVSGLRFTSGGVEEGGDAFDYVVMAANLPAVQVRSWTTRLVFRFTGSLDCHLCEGLLFAS
jgi:hypothetical protein